MSPEGRVRTNQIKTYKAGNSRCLQGEPAAGGEGKEGAKERALGNSRPRLARTALSRHRWYHQDLVSSNSTRFIMTQWKPMEARGYDEGWCSRTVRVYEQIVICYRIFYMYSYL